VGDIVNDFPKLTIDEILNGRKRPQKSIPICLRLDVMAEIEELERRINTARGNAVDDMRMVAGEDDTAAFADRIRELEAEARQYTIDLRVQAVDRTEWSAAVAVRTETDDNGDQKLDMAGVVEDVLFMPGTVVSPEMTKDQLRNLIAGLSDGQWERVMKDVFDLNRRTVDVGKSLTASLVTQPRNEKPAPDAK
jgi:hypothetical protein